MRLTSDTTGLADIDPFNAPVPGQSLTDTPGNYPWEHPPKNTDVEMLLENLFTKLTQPQSVEEIVIMLDAGVPVEAIARVITFTGFAEGEFNPDIGFTIVEPLMEIITAIGIKAGIKDLKISISDISNNEFKDNMTQLKYANRQLEKNGMEEQPMQIENNQGLLAKPGEE